LLSVPELFAGGEVNSLKVVSFSVREAVVWMVSRACERASRSAALLEDMEAREPRRERRPKEGKMEVGPDEGEPTF
jgi:hypothetical protein